MQPPALSIGDGAVLKRGSFRHIAVNPRASRLTGRRRWKPWRRWASPNGCDPRFVLGENIAQTHQFVASGNAELGFVALAQVTKDGRIGEGSGGSCRRNCTSRSRQDAVLLAHGRGNAAAKAFLEWLKGDDAKATIRSFGYDLP